MAKGLEADIGQAIRDMRIRKHLRQKELAKAAGMPPAQLCNLEQGRASPSVRTLERLARAMGITLKMLVDSQPYLEEAPNCQEANVPSVGEQQAVLTHRTPEMAELGSDVLGRLNEMIRDYLELEDRCEVSKRSTIPFHIPFKCTEPGAELLARSLRAHANIGAAIVYDAVELFETQGVRILFTELPENVESLAFFDKPNENFFIFISQSITPVRQQFRMVYEIAAAFLFTANGCRPFVESDDQRRFARHFAAAFLMPEDSIRATALQLNLKPNEWTFNMILRIKARFGVSAESFIIRLHELKLLSAKLKEQLWSEAKEYWRKNDEEPQPEDDSVAVRRKLSQNGRLNDLKTRLGIL